MRKVTSRRKLYQCTVFLADRGYPMRVVVWSALQPEFRLCVVGHVGCVMLYVDAAIDAAGGVAHG